ncbi:hypothetical protein NB714_001650 [Pantoea dispersa]|jgi:hypothetical protein|nr:hypothetical protein Y788_17590 [Pantoea dispersa 625]MCW0320789.1 hypothetical protein [Pantoea dispersa]MCW0325525.1 hypothetical protein [Pantoea dispersa]MCW0430746.1 hypothetical protein [Pantoea dispersa]
MNEPWLLLLLFLLFIAGLCLLLSYPFSRR